MIQRNSDHNVIKTLFSEEKHIPISERTAEMKSREKNKKTDRSWERVSSCNEDIGENILSHKSIISARCGGISNEGGPNKQIKSETSNSIFDNNKISSLKETASSKEKTQAEKTKIAEQRKAENESYIKSKNPSSEEIISNTFDRNASLQEGSKGWVPSHNISMFDNGDFDRLKDPAGEKIEKRKIAKDFSWKKVSKQTTSSDIVNKMYENLTTNSSNEKVDNKNTSFMDSFFNNIKKD